MHHWHVCREGAAGVLYEPHPYKTARGAMLRLKKKQDRYGIISGDMVTQCFESDCPIGQCEHTGTPHSTVFVHTAKEEK